MISIAIAGVPQKAASESYSGNPRLETFRRKRSSVPALNPILDCDIRSREKQLFTREAIVLQDKVVVITGSGQGIGKHAAKTFAKEKAKVVIADFNADLAMKTAAEIGQATEALAVHADVRDEDSVKKMIDEVIRRFGRIDVMMNNAAIVPHFAWNIPRWPLIADMPLEFWDRVVRTNLYGTFFGTKHVIPHMAKQKIRPHHQSLRRRRRKTGRRRDVHGDQGRHSHFHPLRRRRSARFKYVRGDFFAARADRDRDRAGRSAQRLPGPEILGQGFVLCAQLPMEQSGKCFAYENGKLVDESVREG